MHQTKFVHGIHPLSYQKILKLKLYLDFSISLFILSIYNSQNNDTSIIEQKSFIAFICHSCDT